MAAAWFVGEGGSMPDVAKGALRKLNSADGANLQHLNSCSQELASKLDETKGQIYEAVNRHYKEFVQSYNATTEYLSSLRDLSLQIQHVKLMVEDGDIGKNVAIVNEYNSIASQINSTSKTISILEKLLEVHTLLSRFDEHIERGNFIEAASSLVTSEKLMVELDAGKESGADVGIFIVVRNELRRKRGELKALLTHIWHDGVVWEKSDSGTTTETRLVISPSVIQSVAGQKREYTVPMALEALLVFEDLVHSTIQGFGRQAMKYLIAPLIKDQSLSPEIKETPKSFSIFLSTKSFVKETKPKKGKGAKKGKSPEDIDAVFQNLLVVFGFIRRHLALSSSLAPLAMFADVIWPEFSENILESVLAPAIPIHDASMEDYEQILAFVKKFEEALIDLNVVPDASRHVFTNYTSNVRILQSNKKRQELVLGAKTLLLTEGFNTVPVSHLTERGGLDIPNVDPDSSLDVDPVLRETIFRFPACQISTTTHSFVEMIYSAMAEMPSSSPDGASQILYGVRDMLDLYRALVPLRNKELISAVPQFSAIFHNDCFYIAHHLHTLGHQFRRYVPDELRPTCTFVDMIPMFEELGERHHAAAILRQRDALLQFITDAQGVGETEKEDRHAVVEKAVKQVLHTLNMLTNVWKGVMPEEVFQMTVGALLSAVQNKLIAETLSEAATREEINEEAAKNLNAIFAMLLQWSPYTDNAALQAHVSEGPRFVQLLFILQARMADIAELWQSGKVLFTIDETRCLVKALFDNNDKRAALLALLK